MLDTQELSIFFPRAKICPMFEGGLIIQVTQDKYIK